MSSLPDLLVQYGTPASVGALIVAVVQALRTRAEARHLDGQARGAVAAAAVSDADAADKLSAVALRLLEPVEARAVRAEADAERLRGEVAALLAEVADLRRQLAARS